jgi:NAD-dependent deacetylase
MFEFSNKGTTYKIYKNSTVLFITGAGLSKSSGIPTYYEKNGFYDNLKEKPEKIFSNDNYINNPEIFWDYKKNICNEFFNYKENIGHKIINDVKKYLNDNCMIVTQNIDTLHEKAGSLETIHLHGNLSELICLKCNNKESLVNHLPISKKYPKCNTCGNILNQNIVPFGGSLDQTKIKNIENFINKKIPDYIFVIGTQASFPYIKRFIDSGNTNNAIVFFVNQELPNGYQYNCSWINSSSDDFFITFSEDTSIENSDAVNNKRIKEFPDFIVQAISDVVSQYVTELDIKNKDTIYQYSSFSEYTVNKIQEQMLIMEELQTSNDLNFIYKIADERKKLITDNIDLYKQLIHLPDNGIPDYILDCIINGVNFVIESFNLENNVENRNFYCLFGENLCMDIQNYMLLNQINKNKK